MTNKLKPCPFCGGESDIEKQGIYFEAFCTDCVARSEGSTNIEETTYLWNRREIPPECNCVSTMQIIAEGELHAIREYLYFIKNKSHDEEIIKKAEWMHNIALRVLTKLREAKESESK